MSTTDASTLCYRGERCTDPRKRTVTNPDGTTTRVRIPERATAPGLLCRTDTTMTRTAIEQLPMDHLELATLLPKSTTHDTPHSGTREPPAPIRVAVDALAAAILDELERWAEVVADDVGFWYHPRGSRQDRACYAAGWVVGRFERLLTLPPTWHARLDPSEQSLSGKDTCRYTLEAGIDGALRLLALHEQTTLVAGRSQRAERLHSPCPECDRFALEHPLGAAWVDCARCGHRMLWARYEERAGVLAYGGAA